MELLASGLFNDALESREFPFYCEFDVAAAPFFVDSFVVYNAEAKVSVARRRCRLILPPMRTRSLTYAPATRAVVDTLIPAFPPFALSPPRASPMHRASARRRTRAWPLSSLRRSALSAVNLAEAGSELLTALPRGYGHGRTPWP